jgi:hypothetical protein
VGLYQRGYLAKTDIEQGAMTRPQDVLFSKGDLSNLPASCQKMVSEKVENISKDQLLATPEDDLVEHVVSSLLVEPLTVYCDDHMRSSQTETTVDVSGYPDRAWPREDGPCMVSGIRIEVTIPFTGDAQLFKIRPHSFYFGALPSGQVSSNREGGGSIQMVFEFPTDENENRIKQAVQGQLDRLKSVIEAQRQYIDAFNTQLPELARQAIQARRARLARHEKILEHLDIPIQRRPGEPTIQPIQVKRRIVTTLPAPPKAGFKPEPGISDDDFENILAVIRHGGRSFEQTPKTYSVHDEEELRDILLSHLNVFFQGGATAETFRKKGKTDILIQDQDRSAFVAECKVWQGLQYLHEAIEQLLQYLTWRDCKASIVLFNKHNRGLTSIQQTISDAFPSHPRYVKNVAVSEMGESRVILRSNEDDSRLIHCHVFLFNLFVEKKK